MTEVKKELSTDVIQEPVIYTALTEEMTKLPIDEKAIEDSMPEFVDLQDLKDFISEIDTPSLEYLALGLELDWEKTYHKGIHRMRIAMAMQRHFFPELFVPKKKTKKLKFGDLSTEELLNLASNFKLEWKESSNETITRVRIITALKHTDTSVLSV